MKEQFNQVAEQNAGRQIKDDFNQAAAKDKATPQEPHPGMHLRPDAATVEAVHAALTRENISPQLRHDQRTDAFKKRMLVRQSFNRAAKGLEQEQGQDLSC